MTGERPARHVRHPSRLATFGHAASISNEVGRTAPSKTLSRASDDATIAYIKRILCQKSSSTSSTNGAPESYIDAAPLGELLPPLTSSNEIDVQLYAIIAVVLNQFVQVWYNRITPDGDFVGEIVKIIAHCTRGLEQRLRDVDLEALLLDELPFLLDAHLDAVRVARLSSHDHAGPNTAHRTAMVYSALRPHSALSPIPVDALTETAERDNEIAWSQLVVDGILPLVLPPEDLSNPCLNVLVSEIFAQMIVYNAVLGKTSEPWLLWEGVTKAVYTLRPTTRPAEDGPAPPPQNRLEQFGLLMSKEASYTPLHGRINHRGAIDITVSTFWWVLQQAAFAWLLIRSLVVSLMRASSTESRPPPVNKIRHPESTTTAADHLDTDPHSGPSEVRQPIVAMWVWTGFGRLISFQSRMPWLSGILSLLQWLSLDGPGQVCRTNSTLDRWMSLQVHEKLLNAALLPPALHAIRSALFPDNALAPPRVPPTSEEVAAIKRECARVIVDAIPEALRAIYFATWDENAMRRDVEKTLGLFGDQYLNKHLIIGVVELLVVRMFPELAEGENNNTSF